MKDLDGVASSKLQPDSGYLRNEAVDEKSLFLFLSLCLLPIINYFNRPEVDKKIAEQQMLLYGLQEGNTASVPTWRWNTACP